MSQEKSQGEGIPRSRVFIELGEMSAKQQKAILGLIKDMGFTPGEIFELVVMMSGSNDKGSE